LTATVEAEAMTLELRTMSRPRPKGERMKYGDSEGLVASVVAATRVGDFMAWPSAAAAGVVARVEAARRGEEEEEVLVLPMVVFFGKLMSNEGGCKLGWKKIQRSPRGLSSFLRNR